MLIGRSASVARSARHGGEGYLASSADLMIGILFIFIIMVVYLAMEIKRIQDDGDKAADPVRSLVEELGQRLRAKGVKVQLDPDSGVIALPADALFDTGKSIPLESARDAIAKTNEVLSDVVPCYVGSATLRAGQCSGLNAREVELETVMVEGHTDSDQYAKDPDKNWHLGLDRARYIFAVFGSGDLGQLKNRKGQLLLGVSSYADKRPSKLAAHSADPKAQNRRVELRFILSYQGDGSTGGAAEVTKAIQQRQ
jgi:hypothetical protein